VLGAWLAADAAAWQVLRTRRDRAAGDYALQSALLAAAWRSGWLLGSATAAAVTLFDFPGGAASNGPAAAAGDAGLRAGLRLPPTPAVQQPAADGLRQAAGRRAALWPDVRNLWGAVLLFVLCLYPYVYLLARTALGERAVQLMEAARLLGAGPRRRMRRGGAAAGAPGHHAGVALALMETLADYGVGAYFGLTTFSTGIYKAWLVMNDRVAAAQLASVLLVVVALLLAAERRAAPRMRFAASRSGSAQAADARPLPLPAGLRRLAWAVRAARAAGLRAAGGWLARMLWQEAHNAELGLPLARFVQWAWASFRLAGRGRAGRRAWPWPWPSPAPGSSGVLNGAGARAVAGLRRARRGGRHRHPAAGGLAPAALARGCRSAWLHRHPGWA
jgi:iron(III) transport system permease protein